MLVEEANAQAKKAFGKAYSALNRAGKAAFSAFNPTGAEVSMNDHALMIMPDELRIHK